MYRLRVASMPSTPKKAVADEAARLGALGKSPKLPPRWIHLRPGHGEGHRLTGLEGDETVRGGLDIRCTFRDIGNTPKGP